MDLQSIVADMGNRSSAQKKAGPALKVKRALDSQGNCIHIESPVKGSSTVNGDHSMTEQLNSKPQALSPMPHQASVHDLSNPEDIVDGDFTPSCGTTPIHQGSYIETTLPCEEFLCGSSSARSIPEPSPADMKKQLIELFRENINDDLADDNQSFQETVNGKPIAVYLPSKYTSSPYQDLESSVSRSETTPHRGSKSRKEKPTRSAHCCLPNIVRSLSFSERRKRLSPVP
ncbi:hypothetical protein OIU79_004025 [Salix purpurea]|uniref:Uncharacterized protein n=1 Tax=Salix purpurea TaxID=77065 RepID=A0A9Q0Z940_SALPP|nr:hypothetical protein OIU79_004025 [Salix purpurea]